MTTTPIEDYLDQLARALAREPGSDPTSETAEVRQHLHDSARREREKEPTLDETEAQRLALEHFGTIQDYLAARAKPQGWRRVAWASLAPRQRRWALVTALLLALVLIVAGSIALYEDRQRANATLLREPIVLSNFSGPLNQSFTVPSGTHAIRVSLHMLEGASRGSCSNLTVRDAQGNAALAQGAGCGAINAIIPNPAPGTWTIMLSMTNFTGDFEMDVTTQTSEANR